MPKKSTTTDITGLLLLLTSLLLSCLSQAQAQNAVAPEEEREQARHDVDGGLIDELDGSAAHDSSEADDDNPSGDELADDAAIADQDGGAALGDGDAETGNDERGVDETGVDDAADDPGIEEPLSVEVPNDLNLSDDEMWIFLDKSERRMVVNDGQGYREAFRVALGQMPEGDKRREGDGRTPEGEFYVYRRIIHNRFHRFLALSYPGPEDAQRGQRGRMLQPIEYRAILRAHRNRTSPPQDTQLGGNLGIHGYGRRQDRARLHERGRDWTDGCIAVTNDEIERIYEHTRLSTKVVIVP